MKRLLIFAVLLMSVAMFAATSASSFEPLDEPGIHLPASMDMPSVPVQLEPQPNVPQMMVAIRVVVPYQNTSYKGPKMIKAVPVESWRFNTLFSFYRQTGSTSCRVVNNS